MLKNMSKPELTQLANDMASGYAIVKYNHMLYLPVHYRTLDLQDPLPPEERVWIQLPAANLFDLANQTRKVMFYSDSEKTSFYGMVEQAAQRVDATPGTVLVVKDGVLRELRADGDLHEPTQEFCPHFIPIPINDDKDTKVEVLATITEWLDDNEEDAQSLLYHLATVLATHWSAVKYVLLIGEGRNGKSVLLKMLVDLLGEHNVSHVTRQDMAASKSTCLELQDKLVNIVMDGSSSYLKDSGPEKSLTAGETTPIRGLFRSLNTPVRTNGLFLEGLNREPKTGDKSLALQKRLVRFQFTRVYELDYTFEAHMRSEPVLGAFLSLLLDHYVKQSEVHSALRPTLTSQMLQIEQMHSNHKGLQFIAHVEEESMLGANGLIGELLPTVAKEFKSWRFREGDPASWGDKDIEQLLLPLFTTERKSKRINGRVAKVRIITGFSTETAQLITSLRGEEADDQASDSTDPVVADGPVPHHEPAATD